MKFLQTLIPAAGLLSTASAWAKNYTGAAEPPVVTVVTTDYTTYCPYATTFIHKNVTYTATTETTLTITNCPCTVTTKHAPPHLTTEHDTTVTVTNPPETIIADCTPVGPDGKPTPTHEAPAPSQPGHQQPSNVPVPPPAPSQPSSEQSSGSPVSPPAESSPVQVSPNAAGKLGAGAGAAIAGLFAALL